MNKMTAATPLELMNYILKISKIKNMRIECIGLMPYTCILKEKEEYLQLKLDGGELIVYGKTEERFPVELISNVVITKKSEGQYAYGNEIYAINVNGLYFQQFLKKEALERIQNCTWGKRCCKLVDDNKQSE